MFRMGAAMAACAFAFLSTGCGGSAKSASVHGKAQLDGKPLAGAELQFIPAQDAALGQHTITTAADGSFELKFEKGNTPVKPGAYVVVANKWQGASMDAMQNEVPEAYRQQATTPLRAEIREGDNALEPFELTAKPASRR